MANRVSKANYILIGVVSLTTVGILANPDAAKSIQSNIAAIENTEARAPLTTNVPVLAFSEIQSDILSEIGSFATTNWSISPAYAGSTALDDPALLGQYTSD